MKYLYLTCSVLMLMGATVVFSSCKDDEEPKSTLEFETDNVQINESAGTIDIDIVFDRPLSENVTIKFSLSGTADEYNSSTEEGDFNLPDGKTFSVAKGAAGASISVELIEDYDIEIADENNLYETMVVTLTEVQGNAQLGTTKQVTVKILEDDMIMLLDWDRTTDTNIDMDLLVWYYDTDEGEFAYLGGSFATGSSVEVINVPAGFINGTYGLGYPYYKGTDDDLDFSVDFVNLGGTLNGSSEDLTFLGHYTLENINEWEQADETLVVQQMTKTGVNYTDFTEIDEPLSGSRTRPMTLNGKEVRKSTRSVPVSPRVHQALLKLAARNK